MNDLAHRLEEANPVRVHRLGPLDEDAASTVLAAAMQAPARRGQGLARVPWAPRGLLAAVLVLGLGVPLAIAYGGRLVGAVLGSPAPPAVRQIFRNALGAPVPPREGPPGRLSRADLIPGSERLAARIRTEEGGVASLYVARLRSGGWCFMATGRPFDGGGCSGRDRGARARAVEGTSGIFNGTRPDPALSWHGLTFAGRTPSPRATSVRVVYRDGATSLVPVARTHGWFLFEVPRAHERRGHEPVRFDVLDARGRVLGRLRDPFLLHPRPVRPNPPLPDSIRTVAQAPLGWRRAQVVLSSARSLRGDRCLRLLNTGDHVQTGHWICDATVGRTRLGWNAGRRVWPGKPGYVYAYGWAAPPVVRVELRFQDSTVVELPLHDRLFLYVVPPDRFPYGRRPSYLVGLDARGRPVARKFLYPRARCTYPVPDRRCRGIIVANG